MAGSFEAFVLDGVIADAFGTLQAAKEY